VTAGGVATRPAGPAHRRVYVARRAAVVALIAGWAVLLLVVLGGGGGYTVHARFVDAGQLVNGDLVEIGGLDVGKVSDIQLTPDAQADVSLQIDDGRFDPLPAGTTASIRAVGLSGVANRYVSLTPGPESAPKIPNGGVIDMAQTRPIVDLDSVLDSFDPQTRARLRRLLANGSRSLEGVTPQANRTLHYLNPALGETTALTSEIARDQLAFQRLIHDAGSVASTLASRRPDLEQGVGSTAAALRELASRRTALDDALARAPAVLRHSGRTLLGSRRTLQVVPATIPLVRLLRAFGPGLRRSRPLVADLRATLPSLRRAFTSFRAIARRTVPLTRKTTRAVRGALPVFKETRPYAPDFINGFFNGLAGGVGGAYDGNGDYVRITPLQGSGGIFGTSLLAPPNTPGLTQYRTGLLSRCPGGAAEPAADNSNPWVPNRSLCDPSQDHQ
jgi:phospholipid/cholesterol/gamma-HCH transport system substrate-binding protein